MLFCHLPSVCSVQTCLELANFMFLAQIFELLTSLSWTKEPKLKKNRSKERSHINTVLRFPAFQKIVKPKSKSQSLVLITFTSHENDMGHHHPINNFQA